VSAVLAHVLPGLAREPTVQIEVPLEIVNSIAATLALLPLELRDAVTVTGLERLRPGEVRIHWASGQARRQPEQVWESVMAALQPALDHPKKDHPKLDHPRPGSPEAKDSDNGE
jgi:hypothetical protein